MKTVLIAVLTPAKVRMPDLEPNHELGVQAHRTGEEQEAEDAVEDERGEVERLP
jgi:hypothetical protein